MKLLYYAFYINTILANVDVTFPLPISIIPIFQVLSYFSFTHYINTNLLGIIFSHFYHFVMPVHPAYG